MCFFVEKKGGVFLCDHCVLCLYPTFACYYPKGVNKVWKFWQLIPYSYYQDHSRIIKWDLNRVEEAEKGRCVERSWVPG